MHGWHLFDAATGYEVRRLTDGSYEARPVDRRGEVTMLTAAEFEQWRSSGDNPKDLP